MKIGVYQEEVAHVDKDFNVSVSKNGVGYYQPHEDSFESDLNDLKMMGATNIKIENDEHGVKEVSYSLLGSKYKLKRVDFISEHAYQRVLNNINDQAKKAIESFNKYERKSMKKKNVKATHDYGVKEKIKYYKNRVDNPSLTPGQRKWALKRINELRIN